MDDSHTTVTPHPKVRWFTVNKVSLVLELIIVAQLTYVMFML